MNEIRFEDRGRPWRAQLVKTGDKYGLNNWLVNTDGAMVEFYDCHHPKFGARGQFVSRYYLDTLVGTALEGADLNLYGGEPAWTLDANSVELVVKQMQEWAHAGHDAARRRAELLQAAQRAVDALRAETEDPVELKISDSVSIELFALDDGDAVNVCHKQLGWTKVTYSADGVDLMVFPHEAIDPVHDVQIDAAELAGEGE